MMKRSGFISIIIFFTAISFSSCKDKKIELLSKKWDCVNVENLLPSGMQFPNAKDSADAMQLRSMLQSLSWTFSNDMEYECTVGGRKTIHGTYGLRDNETTLICTPSTKNTSNYYTINTLTENDLVLRSNAGGASLVLHFKPH
jgi:hypothetical protein